MKARVAHIASIFTAVIAVLAPSAVVQAAAPNFKAFVGQLVGLIDLATFALFSAAIAFFFWSVVANLWGYNKGDTEQKKKLQETLFWGILVIFIMVSIWGIIEILQLTLSRGLA